MVRFRNRSTSGGSYKEMTSFGETEEADTGLDAKVQATEKLFRALLLHRGGGKSCLHFFDSNPALMTALLDRAQELDAMKEKYSFRKDLLLVPDVESSYTPLHWAVFHGNLASVLFLLRHGLSNSPPRLTQRPMNMLDNDAAMPPLLQAMVTAKDCEGLTPGELLASRQSLELLACRLSLPRPRLLTREGRRQRRSFDIEDEESNDQNEFDLLSRNLKYLQLKDKEETAAKGSTTRYGCEVLTFGQAHHCALGVGNTSDVSSQKVRPQRVQSFSQCDMGRTGAVAVAAAAHHTLVATADGALYAFGLGKGGRLGLGDNVTHCPTPLRVTGGSLSSRKVVGIAAAENHSIAVTSCGYVYTWGSNRFGQLSEDGPSRATPRRVEDLKNSFCVSVAAGSKHSVALSRQGEVYVWGDNTSGQLGISRRNGTHKVQRVEALYSASPPKLAIAVEASEQATLVLTIPTGTGLPVNTIYSWGHGSHVPSRVVFDSGKADRPVNPVAISCARYHNVAVSSDGLVYSWGLHAETLGQKSKKTSTSNMIASPQLVKGMLPENGGGLAVAVSASENHTAVLTDQGAMYTWGATNGKNVMGHAGVRWQPDPKRVPGVSRAVAVAAAKDHTVYLMGASFPPIPELPKMIHGVNSLEDLAVCRIAEFIDLFNAVPLLMVAERTGSRLLIDFCMEFCRRNLDGVLTVAQRSVLDAYLNEQLSGSTLEVKPLERDNAFHPLLEDIVYAGSELGPLNTIRSLCDKIDWLSSCEKLAKCETFRLYLEIVGNRELPFVVARQRRRSLSNVQAKSEKALNTCSDRCTDLVTDMDLSTLELAEQKFVVVTKELRGVKKRLSQISKLENHDSSTLSEDQKEKVARRPQLEADLRVFEPALVAIEKRIKYLKSEENSRLQEDKVCCTIEEEAPRKDEAVESGKPMNDGETSAKAIFRCQVCNIACPDDVSYTLHMNGRKHRNKVTQAKEAEEAKVTAEMLANQTKKKMFALQSTPPKPTKLAWTKTGQSPIKMPCVLPPPPHGAPDSLVGGSSLPQVARHMPSLKDIMAEESRNKPAPVTSKSPVLRGTQKKPPSKPPSSPFLALPAGSAPPLKSPPWAASSTRASLTSPVLRPPDSKSSFSLADYMQKPTSPSPRKLVDSPWSLSGQTAVTSPAVAKRNTVSFADIQQQELASKETEAQTTYASSIGETNKWFIQRRERTGSLLEIQDEAHKERENQLFIAEQLRIEQMIAEENAQREKEERCKRKTKPRNKKKSSGGGISDGGHRQEGAAEKAKPKERKKSGGGKKPQQKRPPSVVPIEK